MRISKLALAIALGGLLAAPLAGQTTGDMPESYRAVQAKALENQRTLLLAMVGLYGVMTFLIMQRTREIGLRMALGAQQGQILGHVFGQAALMAGGGAAAGLLAAADLGRFIESMLFRVGTVDPLTFLAAPLLLTAVAAIALWAPARRAARVDPMVALRQE